MLSSVSALVFAALAFGSGLALAALARTVVLRRRRRNQADAAAKPPANLELGRLAARVGDEIGNPLGYALQNLQHVQEVLDATGGRLAGSDQDAIRDAMFGLTRAADNVRRLRQRAMMGEPEPAELDETDPLLGRGPAQPQTGRGRVLVVDDEEMVGRAVRRGLEYAYAVDVVLSGPAALARLEKHEYDVVVSDLWMPEMDGMQLYREVVARDPAVARRFLFMTGSAADPQAQRFFASIPNICLSKPCGLSDLRSAVESCLASDSNVGVSSRTQRAAGEPHGRRLALVRD